jgi:hypothetical protein
MEKPQTIPTSTGLLMIGTAALFDTFQFILNLIPVVGQMLSVIIVTIPAGLAFWLWFKIAGGSFSKTRQITLGSGFLIEFTPVINALPAWTAAVLICLGSNKIGKWATKIKKGLQGKASATNTQ